MKYLKLFEDIDFSQEEEWEEFEFTLDDVKLDNPFSHSDADYDLLNNLIGKHVKIKVDWENTYIEGILQNVKINKIGEYVLTINSKNYILDERENIRYIKEDIDFTEDWEEIEEGGKNHKKVFKI